MATGAEEYTKILKKINKPKLHLNPIACWILKIQGKKDGKKNIPFEDKNANGWMSPMIKKEHAKVEEYMANVSYYIDKKCGHIYTETEYLISEYTQKYYETLELYNYLFKKSISYDELLSDDNSIFQTKKEMINVKRKNEVNLDSTGLKIRRYNEYYKRDINEVRKEYLTKKNELMRVYKEIMKNYQSICLMESELEIFFCDFCAKIMRRTSCYWHGVLFTHPDKRRLPQLPPNPATNKIYDLHTSKRNDIKAKIDRVENLNKDLLSKDYVK